MFALTGLGSAVPQGGTVVLAIDNVITSNTTNVYPITGDWYSNVQTMSAGNHMDNTTILHSNVDASNYVDRVEWLVGGIVKATYETDINSGTSTTITTPTSGTFADVNADFTVKLYLVGSSTPTIEEISGEFETESGGGGSSTISEATIIAAPGLTIPLIIIIFLFSILIVIRKTNSL